MPLDRCDDQKRTEKYENRVFAFHFHNLFDGNCAVHAPQGAAPCTACL